MELDETIQELQDLEDTWLVNIPDNDINFFGNFIGYNSNYQQRMEDADRLTEHSHRLNIAESEEQWDMQWFEPT